MALASDNYLISLFLERELNRSYLVVCGNSLYLLICIGVSSWFNLPFLNPLLILLIGLKWSIILIPSDRWLSFSEGLRSRKDILYNITNSIYSLDIYLYEYMSISIIILDHSIVRSFFVHSARLFEHFLLKIYIVVIFNGLFFTLELLFLHFLLSFFLFQFFFQIALSNKNHLFVYS